MVSSKRALSVVTDENSMVTKRLCLQKISNHTILTLGETTGIFWYRGFKLCPWDTLSPSPPPQRHQHSREKGSEILWRFPFEGFHRLIQLPF